MSETKRIEKYSFQVTNVIGTGAFSKVYKGTNDQTKEVVAIKVIEMATIKNQTFVNLLQNEVNVMKGLNHPNIVRLEDVYNTPNNIYLVTEFCNSGDVGEIMSKKSRLPESQVLTIVRDIIKGLKELISKKIIHRDLKPQNFFIHNGVHKIGDFGFSKFMKSEDEIIMTTMVGTPLYMAPQCLGKTPYSSKCDIWSFGICLYEMLTGNTPWPSSNHLELLQNMQKVPANFPSELSISQMMKNLILRCLAVNEEFRISWKELFEHPLHTNYSEIEYKSPSKSVVTNVRRESFGSSFAKQEQNRTSFTGKAEQERLFVDKSNVQKKPYVSSNECIDSRIRHASTKKQPRLSAAYTPPSSSLFTNSSNDSINSTNSENCFKILSFMKVICQNIQELKDNIAVTPLVLDKLLFAISKQLAVFCKNAINCSSNLKGDNVHFLHEGKKFFFRIYSGMRQLKGNGIVKAEDPEFYQVFNNELREEENFSRILKKFLIRAIREVNHLCLLKFLKENEDKKNLPHILIFLSALVDFFDIINQLKEYCDIPSFNEIEISKVLTKKENSDVDYYKKIRRKIFELEI